MPVPAVDADKRGDAYKKVKPVEGIDEQGLVPDPQVMHVLFARLMAILGPLGVLPIIFAQIQNTPKSPPVELDRQRKKWRAQMAVIRPNGHKTGQIRG